jgi:hypothetical protein
MDDNIVIAFHSSDTLKIVTKKTKPIIRVVQLPKLMGAPFLKLTLVTLQQGIGTHSGSYQKSSFLVP